VSFTNNQVNFPVANASAIINNTGALINVNAIRYPTSIIILAIAFSIFLMMMAQVFVKRSKRGYRHQQANRLADERHQKKNKAVKLTDSVKNYISEKLKEYWRPEQIMGPVGKYGIFVRRSIVYIFACFTPFSCRIKERLIYPLAD
jgi:hypothetical protein